jgi:thiamine-monophosphate kinase
LDSIVHRPPPSSPSQTVADRTEAELIATIHALLQPAPDWLVVGIGDDGAVVEPERNRLEVLTVDALVDGVHFDRRFTPPDAIGHRALAVNLSDLAAMGASPRLALLSLALPPMLALDDFTELVRGFGRLAAEHRLHLVGGNLTRTPGPLVIDVTLVGTVKRRCVLTRHGARPGDEVYVSGAIGAAAAGLGLLQSSDAARDPSSRFSMVTERTGAAQDCVRRYLYPEPRVRLGTVLAGNRAATACMDLSDGLADAARQTAAASSVGMTIDAATLPIDAAARAWFEANGHDPIVAAVSQGDDYELMFTVRPRLRGRLRTAARQAGIPLTRIGVCTDAREVVLRRIEGITMVDEPMPRGFGHFR